MESSLVAQNKTYSDPLTSVEKQRCQKVLLRRAHVRPWVPEAPNLSKSSKICFQLLIANGILPSFELSKIYIDSMRY